MAYIYPNSTLYILSNVYLNHGYEHTIYFSTPSAQESFFMSKRKFILDNQSYMRKERGYLQVNITQNDLLDCTYLMFRNPRNGHNKWFYAFINSVDYVNEGVSLINFEIDVIQTWLSETILEPCFIDREHTTSDQYYENTVEENIDLGPDFHVQTMIRKRILSDIVCCVESGRWSYREDIHDYGFVPYDATFAGNYFCGMHFVSFDLEDPNDGDPYDGILVHHLRDYVEHGITDAIVAIYQYPRFIGTIKNNADAIEKAYVEEEYNHVSINRDQIDGYWPKNKKLFSYPYNFLEVDDGCGNTCTYKFEQWNSESDIGKFKIGGTPYGIPRVICYPSNYNGETNSIQHGLVYQCDIQCAYLGDAYQVWLARNQRNMALENKIGVGALAVGAGVLALGLAGGPTFGGAMPFLKTGSSILVNNISEKIKAKNEYSAIPSPVYGQIASEMMNLTSQREGFTFRQKTVRAEYAKIIDEFFTKFGYASHRIKVPNRNARLNWTYTKTMGCEITGNIPSDDAEKICSIYDKGITFWNNGNYVGDYQHYNYNNPTYGQLNIANTGISGEMILGEVQSV